MSLAAVSSALAPSLAAGAWSFLGNMAFLVGVLLVAPLLRRAPGPVRRLGAAIPTRGPALQRFLVSGALFCLALAAGDVALEAVHAPSWAEDVFWILLFLAPALPALQAHLARRRRIAAFAPVVDTRFRAFGEAVEALFAAYETLGLGTERRIERDGFTFERPRPKGAPRVSADGTVVYADGEVLEPGLFVPAARALRRLDRELRAHPDAERAGDALDLLQLRLNVI